MAYLCKKHSMTIAMAFFLNEHKMCMSLEYPETGMDYVFKLLPKEWEFLGTIWDDQSDEWKKQARLRGLCRKKLPNNC